MMLFCCRRRFKCYLSSTGLKKFCKGFKSEPRRKYDVVIIGGGHNGLVAASYLARAGASVCVLERRYILGGAAVTEEIIPGFKFSRASYLLSLLRPQIYTELKLKDHGLKVYHRDPYSYTPLREGLQCSSSLSSLTLCRDQSKNYKEIAKFSTKDAEVFQKYEDLLSRLVDALEPLMDVSPHSIMNMLEKRSVKEKFESVWINRTTLKCLVTNLMRLGRDVQSLSEFMIASPRSILSRWFESEPLRATLATDALIGTSADTCTPGIGYVLLHHVMGGVEGMKGAWAYPEGGMGAVSNALARAAQSYGADLFTNQVVTTIKISEGRAHGVVTSTGLEVDASLILSNATLLATASLLPHNCLGQHFTQALEAIDYSSPVTKINVAVSRLPNFTADPNTLPNRPMPHHQATIHLNCEDCNLVDKAFQDYQKGILPSRPMIEMVIPSSVDPTLSPSGAHVVLLFTQFTPYRLAGGRVWDTMVKEEYAQIVFDCIEDYAPGFKASVIGKEVLPPPDLEQIFGLTGGNIFHGAMTLNQLFLSRPLPWGCVSPYTPVRGLLLCGAGAHPGGGVTGAPGRLAALEAIRLLGLRQ